MRWTKIKHKDGRTLLEWEADRDDGAPDCHAWRSSLDAPETFTAALEELAAYVPEITQQPLSGEIHVSQVSFSYLGADRTLAAILSVQIDRTGGPAWCSNTPLALSEPKGEDDSIEACLSADCVEALEQLMREAEKLVRQEAAQGTLPFVKPVAKGKSKQAVN